ncbi:MAG: protein kinase, partial [bacterium]|nr:protein kinase [bacterium]
LFEAVDIFIFFVDKKKFAMAYINIGTACSNLKQFKAALENYRKSVALARQANNKYFLSMALVQVGRFYRKRKDFDRSLVFLNEALEVSKENGDRQSLAMIHEGFAGQFFQTKNYSKALEHYLESLKLRKQLGDKAGMGKSYIHISRYYKHLKNYPKVIEYLQYALDVAEEIDSNLLKADVYTDYKDLYYYRTKDYRKAFEAYRELYKIEKNIQDKKGRTSVNRLQVRYEADKKQQQIALLEKNGKVQQLSLSNARIARNSLLIGTILAVILLVLLFQKYLYLLAFWKKRKYIGQFRLLEQIGSGAAGTVFRARGITDKSRIAAVKILNDQWFKDESTRKRFKQEAVIIDKLEHSNIVKIIERGEYKQQLFTAMEFLPGRTLEHSIRRENLLPLEGCLHIMVQVAEAVAFIHDRDIVHRDLKPENIMLVSGEEDSERVKLLDFGLARMELHSRLTQSGNFVGTLEYMAPEQVMEGETLLANDIFSMGVIFYRLLCGESPFGGETVVEIMGNLIKKKPFDVSVFRMDSPFELNFLVMMMLSKDPRERPTAREVGNDLVNILSLFPP